MVLVDTNVILDVIEDDPSWADWSQEQLDRAAMNGALLINPVIYAELSIAFQRIEEIDLLAFIERKIPEPEVRTAAEVLGARLKNLRFGG